MENTYEKTYWSREIADLLGIGTSTLRKWCLQLERDGYIFLRDEHDRRGFTEHDAIALRRFKEYVANGMTLENASKAVVATYNRDRNDERTLSAISLEQRSDMRSFEVIEELMSYIERQEEFNKALVEQLKRQQEYIENRLNHIEQAIEKRDGQLLSVIREMQETKRLMAAEAEAKKPWWRRLFKNR